MADKLIAITGGIGSGKSLALSILKKAGYNTASSDLITAELYNKRSVRRAVKKLFPSAVSGVVKLKLDKKKIADIVFNDKTKLEKLANLITPLVVKEIERCAKKVQGKFFAEVPVLFEYHYENRFDKIIVAIRPLENRIESVKKRSNLSREQVLERINNQVDYEKIDLSNYTVVLNDGDLTSFEQKILNLAEQL